MSVLTPFLAVLLTASAFAEETILKAGLIGLDTSHATAFTKGLNAADAKGALSKITVVAAYPGGSPDIPSSADRVEGYTKELADAGITIVQSIAELLTQVDVVLLESLDGRPHLSQALPVFKAGKPVFIDKPVAGTLADAYAIKLLGEKTGTPWFTSSSLRYSPEILAYRMENAKIGKVTGCAAWSPCALEPHHPDLFWYGIHGVETLFTIMGPGIERVSRTHTEQADLVSGTWKDGRIGTFRGIRAPGKRGYGAMVFGEKGIARAGEYAGYGPLLEQIAIFFQTKKPPVSHEESLEIYAFMEAADASKRQGGAEVSIADIVAKAEKEAAGIVARLLKE